MNPAQQNFQVELLESPSGARIMKITGALTIQTLFEFQNAARRETAKPVIVDVSGVPYMDSAGLGCIVSIFTSCQRSGRKFALIGISERLRTLLQVTHLEGLLPTFDSVELADAGVTAL